MNRHLAIHEPEAPDAPWTVQDRDGVVATFVHREDAELFAMAVEMEAFRASIEEDVAKGKWLFGA